MNLKLVGFAGVAIFLLYKCVFDNPLQDSGMDVTQFMQVAMEKKGYDVQDVVEHKSPEACKAQMDQAVRVHQQNGGDVTELGDAAGKGTITTMVQLPGSPTLGYYCFTKRGKTVYLSVRIPEE